MSAATLSSVAFSILSFSHCSTIFLFLAMKDGATGSCLFPCQAVI